MSMETKTRKLAIEIERKIEHGIVARYMDEYQSAMKSEL